MPNTQIARIILSIASYNQPGLIFLSAIDVRKVSREAHLLQDALGEARITCHIRKH